MTGFPTPKTTPCAVKSLQNRRWGSACSLLTPTSTRLLFLTQSSRLPRGARSRCYTPGGPHASRVGQVPEHRELWRHWPRPRAPTCCLGFLVQEMRRWKQACVGWGARLWSGRVLEAGHTPDTLRRESQPGTLQAGCRPRLLLRGPSLTLSSGESPPREPCSPHISPQQLDGGWCSENLRGGEQPGGGSHPTGTKRPALTCAPAGGSPASAGCAAPRWQPCPFPAPTLASPGRQPGEQDGGL